MNKTVNINLAGLFFHIDEHAYAKLQRYLDAIRKSFSDPQGRDEIIQDIEARIAELFSEKVKHERQVIGLKEVDEVIEVMGQPEDYRLDEDIFEDEPRATIDRTAKKLYRDTDNSYAGGVCSGLGHYLGIDAIWVRILFVLLTFLTSGGFLLVYAVFWIFVPEARTTSEKLEMRGKPVNIDNIQRKVKEGFENVADSVKNVDYEKYGNQAKKGAGGFLDTLGKLLMFLLTVFVKFLGIILILTGAIVVIGLFIGLFTAGTIGFFDGGFGDYIQLVNTSETPIWLLSLLSFFAIGIPFFALFYLGLKILVNTLKSMSLTAKLVLLGLWLLSVIGLSVIGLRQATAIAVDGEVVLEEALPIRTHDTLTIAMNGSKTFNSSVYHGGRIRTGRDKNNNRVFYYRDVKFKIIATSHPEASISIYKSARGSNYDDAELRAQNINYGYNLNNNTLNLDGFFTTDIDDKYRDQEVHITLRLPEGTTLLATQNTSSFHRNSSSSGDLLRTGSEEKYQTILNGTLVCPMCENIESTNDNQWEYRAYEEHDTDTYNYDEALKTEQDATQVEIESAIDTTQVELDSINQN